MNAASLLQRAARLTVKVGSALLVDPDGRVDGAWLDSLADDVAALRAEGREVVIVTSGAVALGRMALGLKPGSLQLDEKQAAAAVGQITLAQAYREAFARQGVTAAQVLLTLADTEDRRRYLNARATLETLLRLGAVPVVNENDTVATTEIRYGDNDRLSARVAVMATSAALVLLSDVDGLYTADPRVDPDAARLDLVDAVTSEIEAMAGGRGSSVGTGGMITKVEAARIATGSGCGVVLASGRVAHPLRRILGGGPCTLFRAQASPRRARKHWIAGGLAPRGTLTLDAGAVGALRRGGSLLPAGVVSVEGGFGKGDAVLLRTPDGRVVGKGLCAYDAADARLVAGRRTEEIEGVLGYRGRDELVHRDDLVLL